jgi:predicted PurR-regulated permease PerM
MISASRMSLDVPTRVILRIVLVSLGVLLGVYVIYLLRTPISWIVLATFLAVAMSGPVNLLGRYLRRGVAILLSYLGLLLVPVLLGLIVVPPIVNGANDLAGKAPQYARQASDFVQGNRTLRKLENDYGVISKLEAEAGKLPAKLGGAAGVLRDLGVGLVNSVFAGVTILILSIFLVKDGRRWVRRALELQPPDRAERLDHTLRRIASAVGNYVRGALTQAAIAGVTTFIVLTVLGVPFAAPLAVLVAVFDLIPLVGATVAAVIVGIVTLFSHFPTATIVWTIWAIVYQQIENSVIQPQIQRRAVDLHPFLVLVSVLFGSALFGVAGALLAIPVAASLQIAVTEWWKYRQAARLPAAPAPDP